MSSQAKLTILDLNRVYYLFTIFDIGVCWAMDVA